MDTKIIEAAKAAPPLSVTAIDLFGIALQDWMYIVTITYTLLLTSSFLYKLIKRIIK